MSKFNFFSKLKSQKGATGVDIVVSISVIVITIVVITSIYTNIDLTSKKVERTAGATRIATNILEDINKMYYEEFTERIEQLYTFSRLPAYRYMTANKVDDTDYYYTVEPKKTTQNVKFFNTKIPKGYIVDLNINNTYGSDTTNKYDIVKNIEVVVKYNVGKNQEEIKLSTAKAMEIVDECNAPIFAKENFEYCEDSVKNNIESLEIIPVKKLGASYVRTTVTDPLWYNYENKDWAKIIIDDTYCDDSGNLKPGYQDVMYVWVPNYGMKDGNLNFRYKSTKYKIKKKTLNPKVASGVPKEVYTVDKKNVIDDSLAGSFEEEGYWIKVSDILTNEYSSLLNENRYGYGPVNI